jgi:hypothetical protein
VTTLTAAQIGAYANQAGFKGDGLVWSIAIALAESGGNTTARGHNSNGSVDRGLWQFNSHAHPEVSDAEADNPASAAAAAYRVSSHGTNWHQWATYNSGAARKQLPAAQTAATLAGTGRVTVPALDTEQALSVPGLGDLTGITKSLASIASVVITVAKWVANPHNWVRIMEVVAGGTVIVIGLHMLAQSGVGGPVAGAARAVDSGVRNTAKKAQSAANQAVMAVATDGASLAAKPAMKAAASKAAPKSSAVTPVTNGATK